VIGNTAGTTLGAVLNGPQAVAFREGLQVADNPICQRCVCSLYVETRSGDQPTVQQMRAIYRTIKTASPLIMKNAGAKSLFEARVFRELVVLARKYVELSRTMPDDGVKPAAGKRGG
jgi:hypothetical protein